jgi:ribosomal protein S15P/S13E
MSEPVAPVPADAVAASYVELTVAIVTVQEQVAMLARHQVAMTKHLDALHGVALETVGLLKAIAALLDDEGRP